MIFLAMSPSCARDGLEGIYEPELLCHCSYKYKIWYIYVSYILYMYIVYMYYIYYKCILYICTIYNIQADIRE